MGGVFQDHKGMEQLGLKKAEQSHEGRHFRIYVWGEDDRREKRNLGGGGEKTDGKSGYRRRQNSREKQQKEKRGGAPTLCSNFQKKKKCLNVKTGAGRGKVPEAT